MSLFRIGLRSCWYHGLIILSDWTVGVQKLSLKWIRPQICFCLPHHSFDYSNSRRNKCKSPNSDHCLTIKWRPCLPMIPGLFSMGSGRNEMWFSQHHVTNATQLVNARPWAHIYFLLSPQLSLLRSCLFSVKEKEDEELPRHHSAFKELGIWRTL